MRIVVKVGSSSLTDENGVVAIDSIASLSAQLAEATRSGHEVVLVSSGAVASGLPVIGLGANTRPSDPRTLQAIASVGQARLMQSWNEAFADNGLIAGQVLMAPRDFMDRSQYLQARGTLERLIELGVVPIVNENDTVANDEIRFGDNDRIAALVAHLVRADLLVMLTDIPGVMDADPNIDDSASLIEEIEEVDADLEALAGGSGTARGSGGMATKLAAAKMASWSGIRVVIGASSRPGILMDAVNEVAGAGTTVKARDTHLSARKLWIAFAVPSVGRLVIDAGAADAVTRSGSSLLAAGITGVEGRFNADDAVDVVDGQGRVIAKGLTHMSSNEVEAIAGRRSEELTYGSGEVIHRDSLVVLA